MVGAMTSRPASPPPLNWTELTSGLVAICRWAITNGHDDIAYNYARTLGTATRLWFRAGGSFR